MAEVTAALDAGQTLRYAEASGDTNTIHVDDEFARSVGLPGIILHGMCTMAICAQAVIDGVADSDPARLRRLAVRFSKPVLPDSDLVTTIYSARHSEARWATPRTRSKPPAGESGSSATAGPRSDRRPAMPMLRLFASAREAAGVARTEIDADTVGELLDEARRRFGGSFAQVLDTSRVWVNGQPADPATPIEGHDVVAVLPPVSGGANRRGRRQRLRRRQSADGPQGRRLQLVRSDRPPDTGWSGTSPPHSPDALARVPLQVVPPLPEEIVEEAPAPVPSALPKPRSKLAVVHQSVRPHGRLGVAWAMVTAVVVVAGPFWLAMWLALGAFVAATQTCKIWRARGERPLPAFAAIPAAALPLAAAVRHPERQRRHRRRRGAHPRRPECSSRPRHLCATSGSPC